MNEKIESAVELTDEETEKAAGGHGYPENYIPCQFVSKPHGIGFCKYACKYNGKGDCKDSHHNPIISVNIQIQYDYWLETLKQP